MIINTKLFSFKDKVFVAEVSDIPELHHEARMPHLIELQSERTNNIQDFILSQVNKDDEGDILYWLYESREGLSIKLFND